MLSLTRRLCSSLKPGHCRLVSSQLAQNAVASTNKPAPGKEKPYGLMGQPTHLSHSHFLNDGELVVGIKLEEIRERRQRFMESIQKYTSNLDRNLKNHIVVIPSATKKYMTEKIPYVFRQNSDFLYLSGCQEPDSALVMTIDESGVAKSFMVMRPKDANAEMWDGPRTGVENAADLFGTDDAFAVKDLQNFLTKFISGHRPFTFWYDSKSTEQRDISDTIQLCLKNVSHNSYESPTAFVHKLRVIKSNAEIELMRKTCRIASEAINRTISESRPGTTEHKIFARVDYHCRMNDASFLAYPPVVAAGKNATTIHYINNLQRVNSGELVLMDAGCEYGGYTSDITRTWPINGKFSPSQQLLYEILLTTQRELIGTLLHNGGQTLDQLFDTMCMKLGLYLKEIGIIAKDVAGNELAKKAYSFCPHHVSHYLGMDVHDTGLISRRTNLVPGMICTVEPGIYIGANRLDVPKEFRGIGIRIEDDVLIKADNSVEVLTELCTKDLKQLEILASA